MENWIEDIKKWDTSENEQQEESVDSLSNDEIMYEASNKASDVLMFFSFVEYLSLPFGETDSSVLLRDFLDGINTFLNEQIQAFRGEYKINNEVFSIEDLSPNPATAKMISKFTTLSSIDNGLKYYIDDMVFWYFSHWLDSLYFPTIGIHSEKDAVLYKKYYDERLADLITTTREGKSNG